MFVDLGRWRDISSLTCMGNNSHSIPFNFYLNRWHCPPRHPSQDNCWKLGQTPSPRSKNAKNIQKHPKTWFKIQDVSRHFTMSQLVIFCPCVHRQRPTTVAARAPGVTHLRAARLRFRRPLRRWGRGRLGQYRGEHQNRCWPIPTLV